MSNAVFPTLAGLTFPVVRKPLFNTMIQTGVDLSELRATFTTDPIYDLTLAYDILRNDATNEFKQLCGFFEARQGRFDSFLFTDPDDSSVAAQQFGLGDGATANFQLLRSFGDANASVANLNSAPTITVNNVPNSNFTQTAGLIHFTSPPAANAILRWTGTYYMRCRFLQDTVEFDKFMRIFWQAGQVELHGCFGTKI